MISWLMIVTCIGGAIWAARAAACGQPWGRPLAVVCSLSLLALTVWNIMASTRAPSMSGWSDRKTMMKTEGKALGDYLGHRYHGNKVWLLPPLDPQSRVDYGVDALSHAVSGALDVERLPADPALLDETTTGHKDDEFERGEELLVHGDIFRRMILDRTTPSDIVIIASDHNAYLQAWRQLDVDALPSLVLLHAPDHDMEDLFFHDQITAATLYTPPPEAREIMTGKAGKKPNQSLIDRFYSVADQENYAELLRN